MTAVDFQNNDIVICNICKRNKQRIKGLWAIKENSHNECVQADGLQPPLMLMLYYGDFNGVVVIAFDSLER